MVRSNSTDTGPIIESEQSLIDTSDLEEEEEAVQCRWRIQGAYMTSSAHL